MTPLVLFGLDNSFEFASDSRMMPFWVLTGIAKTLQDLLISEIPSNACQLGRCESGATSYVNENPCIVNRVLVRFSFFGTRARIQFCETTVGTRFGATVPVMSRTECRIWRKECTKARALHSRFGIGHAY